MEQLKQDVINVESQSKLCHSEIEIYWESNKTQHQIFTWICRTNGKDPRTIAPSPPREKYSIKQLLIHGPLIKMEEENNSTPKSRKFFENIDNIFATFTSQ